MGSQAEGAAALNTTSSERSAQSQVVRRESVRRSQPCFRRHDSRRYSYCRRTFWNVFQHDGVGANARMITNSKWAENLGTSANINMTAYPRCMAVIARADGYLLEEQTIHADVRAWVNDDAVRVRDGEASADLAVDRNVRAGDDAPEPVSQNGDLAHQHGPRAARLSMPLVGPDAGQQGLRRFPGPPRLGFARPVGCRR